MAHGLEVERQCTLERALELAGPFVDEALQTHGGNIVDAEKQIDRWVFSIEESAAARGTLLQKKGDA